MLPHKNSFSICRQIGDMICLGSIFVDRAVFALLTRHEPRVLKIFDCILKSKIEFLLRSSKNWALSFFFASHGKGKVVQNVGSLNKFSFDCAFSFFSFPSEKR